MRRRIVLGSILLSLPATAWAQIGVGPMTPVVPPKVAVPTTTLPQNPTSPTQLPPVGRFRRTVPSTTTKPGGDGSGGVQGYSGGDFIIADHNPALWGGLRGRKKVPKFHLVKQGDTLWNICKTYYGDPWAWPQLWSINQNITNPHWIYPGDKIALLGGQEVKPPPGSGREKLSVVGRRRDDGELLFKQNAFVDAKELDKTGTVKGSESGRRLLSRRDKFYLSRSDKFVPTVGRSYSVYRTRRKLKNSRGEDLGYLVEVLGTARVKRAPRDKLATAQITESVAPIERGQKVGPLRRRYRKLPLRRADRNAEGKVIAGLAEKVLFANQDVVFVDLGRDHGVQVGNRFLVIREGDGARRVERHLPPETSKEWPREVVAEIAVLDAHEKLSIGLITRAVTELEVGEPVLLRKGY